MSEIFKPIYRFIEKANVTRLHRKTQTFLHDHRITVSHVHKPDYSCLILSTHPTIWDSIFWRATGTPYQAVHHTSSNKTGIEAIDIPITRMIPVYQGNNRSKTYQLIAQHLNIGHQVVLYPTGVSSGTDAIPLPEEIKMGAFYRSLQKSAHKTTVAASIQIEGDILPDYTVKNGAKVKIFFAEKPFDFTQIDFQNAQAPESLKEEICQEWERLSMMSS